MGCKFCSPFLFTYICGNLNYMIMGKCILLSRVSTLVQDLEQQTNELKKEAYKLGYSDYDIILIEDKESAVLKSFEEREGITKLIDTINSEDIERIICYEISRIARRPDVFYKVRDILIEKKIQLQVLTPGFCLLNDDGSINENSNLLIGIFLSMSESEGRIRKARTQRGKVKRATDGKYNGGKICFGYYIDKEGYYRIDEQDAETVRKIFKLYTEYRYNPLTIARELMATGELWQRKETSASRFIFYLLRNPIYATGTNKDSHVYKNHPKLEQKFIIKAPKLISMDVWNIAQERNNELNIGHKNRVRKNIYYAHDIIFDMNGHRLHPNAQSNQYLTGLMDRERGVKCLCVQINMIDSLLYYVLDKFLSNNNESDRSNNVKVLRQKQTDCFNKITKAKNDIEQYQKEIDKIEERIISGRLDDEKGNEMQEERYDKMLDLEVKITSWEDQTVKIQEHIEEINMSDRIYNISDMDDQEIRDNIKKYVSCIKVEKLQGCSYRVYVDNEVYEMNTNHMSKWIKYNGEKINFKYLERFKRKGQ